MTTWDDYTHIIAAYIAANATEPIYAPVAELPTSTHTPFSLAFEEAERELGERIGYPALVYDGEEPAPRERPIANYGAARFEVIDKGRRRAVFDSFEDAVLFCDAAGL